MRGREAVSGFKGSGGLCWRWAGTSSQKPSYGTPLQLPMNGTEWVQVLPAIALRDARY